MLDADPTSGVEQGIELLVSILEPRLGARGSLIGAKVVCDPPETLSPDQARRLADALERAADLAHEADGKLIPILEAFVETRDRLLAG
jgi:hypothetical protein